MNRSVKTAMAGGAVVLALGALPVVQAAPPAPEEQAFRGKTEVSDAALSNMRGRFVSADQILYFGVEMYTEWRTAEGDLHRAALNIGIDRSGASPTVSVSSNVQVPNPSNDNGGGSSGGSGGGLDQVQGVSQLVQVTGNGNGVTNAIGVDVVTQPGVPPQNSGDGNQWVVDEQTGATAQTIVNGGASVIVSYPTQGTASQSVASMTGIQQRAQVSGDGHNIHNQLNMVIQVQPDSTASSTQMRNLAQTTRGLWQAGIN